MAIISFLWVGTDSWLINSKLIKYLNRYLQRSDTNSHISIDSEDIILKMMAVAFHTTATSDVY